MNEIRIKYQFMVFLYAYLNQIDLSLDRSRWTTFEELRKYYKTQVDPLNVLNYLLENSNLDINHLKFPCYIVEISFLSKVKAYLFKLLKKDSFLKKNEICYCCQKLLLFSDFLKDDSEIHKLEIERLRIEFSKLNFQNIKFKISSKDRNKSLKIEHYLQNEILQTLSIKEFIEGFKL